MQRLFFFVMIGLMAAGLVMITPVTKTLAEDAPAPSSKDADKDASSETAEPTKDKKEGDKKAKAKVDLKVLADPSHKKMNLTAPATFEALFKTTKGDFTVVVTRKWAPIGADRFYSLVKNGYFDGTKFFRVVPGFVVQWGLHGDAKVNLAWYDEKNRKAANLKDDPVKKSNKRGTITFANAGPNTRSSQVFINFGDNARLDDPKKMRGAVFAPFGKVKGDGMKVVEKLYSKYPLYDGFRYKDPRTAVSQGHLVQYGNRYLDTFFPKLDKVISATIVEQGDKKGKAKDGKGTKEEKPADKPADKPAEKPEEKAGGKETDAG